MITMNTLMTDAERFVNFVRSKTDKTEGDKVMLESTINELKNTIQVLAEVRDSIVTSDPDPELTPELESYVKKLVEQALNKVKEDHTSFPNKLKRGAKPKFNLQQKREILAARKRGMKLTEICKKFDITSPTIYKWEKAS